MLNAYYPMGSTAGGFRTWWRRMIGGSDAEADAVLDDAHLMRLAGRFARRVRAWAADNAVPVIDCTAGERKHLIAEEYLRTHSAGPGVFLILAARAPAMVWDVRRSADGAVIGGLARKRTYVNHYSFHIMDPAWGHLVIKMAGHAPFAAQVILNGHGYVAVAAQAAGIGFTKEGNCFTGTTDILAVFDSGYDLTRLAWLLRDLPVEVAGRLRSDRVMHFPAPPRPARPAGTGGRPPRHGAVLKLSDPQTWPAPAVATATETTRYGTARATAWGRLHQRLASRAGWENHHGELPVIEGTLIRLAVDHLPGDRSPDRCGYGPRVPEPPPPRSAVPGRRSCAASISNTRSGS